MPLTAGEESAIVGGGGLATVGAVYAIVKRYAKPRFDAVWDELRQIRETLREQDRKLMSHDVARNDLRERVGLLVTGAHERANIADKERGELVGRVDVLQSIVLQADVKRGQE